jgi:hypothetical protein
MTGVVEKCRADEGICSCGGWLRGLTSRSRTEPVCQLHVIGYTSDVIEVLGLRIWEHHVEPRYQARHLAVRARKILDM